MAKAKETPVVEEPKEFPVSLEEFLSEVSDKRVEAKAMFRHEAREQIGKKQRSEWQAAFDKLMESPVGTKITW